MRVLFYAPFKPIDHPHPSGDRIIGRGLFDFLSSQGHDLKVASRLRARWIYLRPAALLRLIPEFLRLRRLIREFQPHLWLTYHTYYKAPDLLGPLAARCVNLPYIIFQGIYSTKRRRRLKTWPGFALNRMALQSARHVFTNRRVDQINLMRLLPEARITYIRPGIPIHLFQQNREAGTALKTHWRIAPETPVILTAAMFRPDVKTQGLEIVIEACRRIKEAGLPFHLVIAGDGQKRPWLERLASAQLPGRVTFAGLMPRETMHHFYSAGDLFAFPGIRESLGMVYLEAQACGLPVVAFDNGGIPEVVRSNQTGILTTLNDIAAFTAAITRLLCNPQERQAMGVKAARYVRENHDFTHTYALIHQTLMTL